MSYRFDGKPINQVHVLFPPKLGENGEESPLKNTLSAIVDFEGI